MTASSNWQLVPALSIYQAALLMTGEDPVDYQKIHIDDWDDEIRKKVMPIVYALKGEINMERIDFVQLVKFKGNENYESNIDVNIDWFSSTVSTADIVAWIHRENVLQYFFKGPGNKSDIELVPSSKYFSIKLFAANAVWRALVSNPHLIRKTSVKRAATNWLEQNAKEYGLLRAGGEFNRKAIDEIATVVNWQTKGGAPSSGEVQ